MERPWMFYNTGAALLLLALFLVVDAAAAFLFLLFKPGWAVILVPLFVVSGIVPTLVDRRLGRRDERMSEFWNGEDEDGD